MDMHSLMKLTAEKKASDLHLSADKPPILRLDGNLVWQAGEKISSDHLRELIYSIMTEHQRKEFEETLESDFGVELEGVARFRVNVFKHHSGLGCVMRRISLEIPSFERLQMSNPIFQKICDYPNGIVLVTGPTGSGKSTTLAAMIDYMNKREDEHLHIITIEDPIEYVYTSGACLIHQREVGADTHGFSAPLRAALREDPDVILVGEMRDMETIRLALSAAETGHLVFATMHTNSAAKTIDRIVDSFPKSESAVIAAMLAESIRAVIAQTLLPRIGGGRVAAHEIMIANSAIRNLIREQKIPQIYSAMQTSIKDGMITMSKSIEQLVEQKLIEAPKFVDDH